MSMQEVIRQARVHHRANIEQMYEDTCTVIEYRNVKDPVSQITKKQEVTVLENQPCKLSFSTTKATDDNNNVATVSQVVKLFVSPDIIINPGSKIVVNHYNKEFAYKNSSEPSTFYSHQEIALEIFKRWA